MFRLIKSSDNSSIHRSSATQPDIYSDRAESNKNDEHLISDDRDKNRPEKVRIAWTINQKIIFRIAFIFFSAFCIPWDAGFYRFLYNLDYTHITYGNLTEIVAFYNPQFINIFSASGFFGWASYINLPFILIIAVIGGLIWTVLDKNKKEYSVLYYWVRVLARYRVAYAGIAWGYKKLFIMQMPFPNVGLQHTEFIDFFAKRLYWESIGIAPHYEVFLGFAEFIGGFLLLFRKTTALGAAIAMVVFANIAIANHAYDIGEQVPSACMAMLALFVLWYYIPGIYKLIVKQENTRIITYYPSFKTKWKKYTRFFVKYAFNFIFVVLFLGLEVYAFMHNDFYKIPNTPGLTAAKGFYNVTEFKLNNKLLPYSPYDSIRWQDATFEDWSSVSFRVVNRPQQIEMFAAGSYPRLGEVYDNKWTIKWEGDVRRFGNKKHKKYDPLKRDIGIGWELSGIGSERHWYYYKADTIKKILYLQNKNRVDREQKQVLHYRRPSASRIILWGVNEFNDSVHVVLDRDDTIIPLLKDGRKPVPDFLRNDNL